MESAKVIALVAFLFSGFSGCSEAKVTGTPTAKVPHAQDEEGVDFYVSAFPFVVDNGVEALLGVYDEKKQVCWFKTTDDKAFLVCGREGETILDLKSKIKGTFLEKRFPVFNDETLVGIEIPFLLMENEYTKLEIHEGKLWLRELNIRLFIKGVPAVIIDSKGRTLFEGFVPNNGQFEKVPEEERKVTPISA